MKIVASIIWGKCSLKLPRGNLSQRMRGFDNSVYINKVNLLIKQDSLKIWRAWNDDRCAFKKKWVLNCDWIKAQEEEYHTKCINCGKEKPTSLVKGVPQK